MLGRWTVSFNSMNTAWDSCEKQEGWAKFAPFHCTCVKMSSCCVTILGPSVGTPYTCKRERVSCRVGRAIQCGLFSAVSLQGDSGGPLSIRTWYRRSRHTLIGVASLAVGCGQPNQPSVYTRVHSVSDWLIKNMPDASYCWECHPPGIRWARPSCWNCSSPSAQASWYCRTTVKNPPLPASHGIYWRNANCTVWIPLLLATKTGDFVLSTDGARVRVTAGVFADITDEPGSGDRHDNQLWSALARTEARFSLVNNSATRPLSSQMRHKCKIAGGENVSRWWPFARKPLSMLASHAFGNNSHLPPISCLTSFIGRTEEERM